MWLLPTYNRPEKLRKCLQSAVDTGTTTPCLILVDEEDRSYEGLEFNKPDNWVFKSTKSRKMADKVREVFDEVTSHLGSEWVGLCNDDHHFVTPSWDNLLVAKLDGTNFVSPNDRQPDRRAFSLPVTATAFSTPLLKAVGFPIYPPDMKHLFIDNLWMELGKASGCWRMCASVIVEHHHVLWGKAEMDDTHKQVYSHEAWTYDEQVFKKFMKDDFKTAVDNIKGLQGSLPIQRYNQAPSRKDLEKAKSGMIV